MDTCRLLDYVQYCMYILYAYPRRLNWIQTPRCRLCGYPSETTVHLLSDCPGTYPTRASLGISFDTLVHESPENIIRIARFDAWLRQILPVEQSMTDCSLLATLTKNASCPVQKRTKTCYLVIPRLTHHDNKNFNNRQTFKRLIDRSKEDPHKKPRAF
jgi:hypothetical protein